MVFGTASVVRAVGPEKRGIETGRVGQGRLNVPANHNFIQNPNTRADQIGRYLIKSKSTVSLSLTVKSFLISLGEIVRIWVSGDRSR